MRNSFIFYRSIYEAIRDLPRDVQGEIYTAIMEYGLYGKETEQLKPIARSIFTLVKPLLHNDITRFENGKRGGRPKNLNKTETEPKNNRTETEQKPNQNQSETTEKCVRENIDNILDNNLNLENNNNSLSPLPSPSLADAEFEKFWNLYNKKQDRKRCEAKFKKLSKTDKAKIFETLPAYVASTPDEQYRKNPLTYLNGECWNNEIINRNGTRQTSAPSNRQSADLSKFRDESRHYSSESDF
ncbi:MAG: hypothetical protein J6A59_05935 [Lachnospiraceae bacterium]|nr:hypothetical protein [Lachnospiraceae bacterium]MBO5407434.1 hypothetical protein [Bacteroidales bacterium]